MSNPMELIGNGRLKGLLHRLAPLFDWIVIDSPPCVPLSDASVLADLCDGVLMVVLAGKTPFDMAQKGGQQFREKRLLGVVLNHVPPQASYSAHYYHAADDNPAGTKKIASGHVASQHPQRYEKGTPHPPLRGPPSPAAAGEG